MLLDHLSGLESTNGALSATIESLRQELHQRDHQKSDEQTIAEAAEARDVEALLGTLSETEQRNKELALQSSRLRVENNRLAESLRVLEEEQMPPLLQDRRTLAVVQRERDALHHKVKELEGVNQELVSTVHTMEYLHARKDAEWQPVAAAIVARTDVDFLGVDGAAWKQALTELQALIQQCKTSQHQQDMSAFLHQHLPTHVRWLVLASVWQSEFQRMRSECEQVHRECSRLREELDMVASQPPRGLMTPTTFNEKPPRSPAWQGSPLVVLQQEQEFMQQWEQERAQLLELINSKEVDLIAARGDAQAEVQKLSEALKEVREQLFQTQVQLNDRVEASDLQDALEKASALQMMLDDARRRAAELTLHNGALQNELGRVVKALEISDKPSDDAVSRRRSVEASVPENDRRERLKRAATIMSLGPEAMAAQHREADAVTKRLVTMERNLHTAQFQRQRYEMLWNDCTRRYEALLRQADSTLASERARAQDALKELESAKTQAMDLFFAFAV